MSASTPSVEISFVIPAYNEEALLGACIQSIQAEIARSGCEAEILVVDNASTDRTGEIARAFGTVTVIDEPRKGTNRARETGYEHARGMFVATIDADSLMPVGWITSARAEFARNQCIVAVGGPYHYYDLSPISRLLTELFQFGMYLAYLFNRFVLKSGSQLLGGNSIMRRSALEKIGGFDTSFTFFGDDLDTARRLMSVGDVLWTYRLPIGSSGRRFNQQGIVKAGYLYLLNFLSFLYDKRVFSRSHDDFRSENHADEMTLAKKESTAADTSSK